VLDVLTCGLSIQVQACGPRLSYPVNLAVTARHGGRKYL